MAIAYPPRITERQQQKLAFPSRNGELRGEASRLHLLRLLPSSFHHHLLIPNDRLEASSTRNEPHKRAS